MSLSSQTTATIPQKRPPPEEEAEIVHATPKRDSASPQSSSVLSTPLTLDLTQESPLRSSATQPRPSSPTPSSNTSISGERRNSLQNGTATAVPTKRRRLTVQEKEEKRLEKDAKDRERAGLKAKREEEKRIKDEERRQKNEEREEKKREKELEKQQKEEERLKKERSQLKLNTFFTSKNSTAIPTSPTKYGFITKEAARRKSLTLEPDVPLLVSQPTASSSSCQQDLVSDYELFFLPFSLPSNAICAPHNAFLPDEATLRAVRGKLDGFAQVHEHVQDASLDYPMATSTPNLECAKAERSVRGTIFPSVRDIMARLHGSFDNPIDLTDDDSAGGDLQPLELLQSVPMKYLHFGEDVRPPYYGTFTRTQSRQQVTRLSRNPVSRGLLEINYDYDSEAEWEEPEEGEDVDSDLDSDGEEDMDSNEGDDMEGFLDDEESTDPAKTRRGIISSDLEPLCSGLCWEDSSGHLIRADGSAEHVDLGDCAIGFLLDPEPHTVDPWSTAYWPDEQATAAPATTATKDPSPMNPPRLPLHARPHGIFNNANIASPGLTKSTNITATATKPSKVGKRLVPDEYMHEFKQAIQGSDLTKLALIEALKKRFPKLPKDAINNTLGTVAARVGSKEVDKRWVLVPNS